MNNETIEENGIWRWPDLYVGSEEYFVIDCTEYLRVEKDTLSSVVWTLPTGLTSLDEVIIELNKAAIKISASTSGTYYIKAEINTREVNAELGETLYQKTHVKIKLVVEDI